jgi:O-antigen/teichoic acid export membrane protein
LEQTTKLNRFNSLQIFQFLRFGTFFLISILLAKISAFYQHDYGLNLISQYENLMLVTSSLTFFWVSAICNTLIPYYNNANSVRKKKVLFNTFVLLTAFSILAAIVVVIMGRTISGKDKYLFDMFALVVLLNTPTYITDYIYYLTGQYRQLIRWGVITFVAQILLLCVPLAMGYSLGLAINMLLLLSMVKFSFTILLLMKYATISVQTRLSADFLKKAVPIMFSILLAGSMEYVNSYIVEFNFSKETFAMFRYGARELPIFLILANSLSNVYSGEISKYNIQGKLEEGLSNLKKSSQKLMRWLFPATVLSFFLSPYLFKYAYNEQLMEGYKVFNIYLLLIISRMVFPQTVIMGILKNRVFYVISSNYLIINIILSFWFIYLIGDITGIAYATVISYTIEKLMLIAVCKMEGISLRKYTPIGEWIAYSLLTLVAYYASLFVHMPGI